MDPADPKGLRAWGRALLQSGGLGIYGDMLGQDKTKVRQQLAATLAGHRPAWWKRVLGQFLLRNIGLAAQGKETNFAVMRFLCRPAYLRALASGMGVWPSSAACTTSCN